MLKYWATLLCYGNFWHLYKNYCLLTGATAWKHMCNVVIVWWILSAYSLVVSYSNSQKDWRLTHSINTQLLSKMHVCVWIFRFIDVVIKWLIEKRYFGVEYLIYTLIYVLLLAYPFPRGSSGSIFLCYIDTAETVHNPFF